MSPSRTDQPTCHRYRAFGYTLIEMMVVMIILALGVTAAAPSMIGASRQKRLYAITAGISDVISEARLRAQGRGAAHIVDIDIPRRRVSVFEAVDGTGIPVGSCRDAVATGAPALTSSQVDGYDWSTEALGTLNMEVVLVETSATGLATAATGGTARYGFCINASGNAGRVIAGDPTVIGAGGWQTGLPPFQVIVRPTGTNTGVTRTLSVSDYLRNPRITAQ